MLARSAAQCTTRWPCISSRALPISDIRKGPFEATTDAKRLGDMDAISIAVPTPLSKTRDPDMAYVLSATETVARSARPGQVIILESTTYPGTTREMLQPAMEARGLVVGR